MSAALPAMTRDGTGRAAFAFRTAAILTGLYAALHTWGFHSFRPPSVEGAAVLRSMQAVRFGGDGGPGYSYGDFYEGFGLFIGLALLVMAVLTWRLADLSKRHPREAVFPAATLALFQLASLAICARFFSPPPAFFSGLIAALLAFGAWSLTSVRTPAA